MSAYEASYMNGHSVTIHADDSTDRRSRAAQATAVKRRYERLHGVRLTLASRSYSETHGFLSRSAFRYTIERSRAAR
jgi:hypothetical protein